MHDNQLCNMVPQRIIMFCGVIAVIFITIIVRMAYLQINLSDYFFTRSQQNFLHISHTTCARGTILDCNGTLLATNRPRVLLTWIGSGNRTLTTQQQEVLALLEMTLQTPILSNEQCMRELIRAERTKKNIVLHTDVSAQQLSKISEQLPADGNIHIISDSQRYYPHQEYASHVLGYLGGINTEHYGKMGLEKLLEDSLRGQKGTVLTMIDSIGRPINQTTLQHALTGTDIHTTLDIDMQAICERVFTQECKGAFIIMNPIDGSIVSMLSRPNFDPNIFLRPISAQEWETILEKKPFLNRGLNATYPLGSIFKLITISAAFQEGIVPCDMHYTTTCKGYYKFCGRKYWCNNHYGHGEVNIAQSIAESCNIIFFNIGRKIDIDVLAYYASLFGIGKKTNISLPESSGLMPTRAWKKATKGESWWPGETVSASIGQSFICVTPIQVARMISAIFTGYLVKPRILVDEKIEKETLPIPLHIRKFLKKSMKRVVRCGTGIRLRKFKDIKMYAKTSTAQTSDLLKRDLGTQYLEHGWFVGNFTYKDNTPLTIVILVEHAGSAQVAAGIAQKFVAEYKILMDTRAKAVA